MATKIVATDAAAKAEIIAAVRVRMNRGFSISGMTYISDTMVMEIRGVNGVVSDIITPFIRAGKATYWEPAWKRAV